MKYLLIIIALFLISFGGYSQNHDFAKLDQYLAVLDDHDRFHGSVAVTKGGEAIYSRALGLADMESARRNNPNTKFRIGSISKTFTATLIMQAVEKGKLGLDQTIDKWFPRIQNAKKITVRHLLNHKSGITSFTDRNYFTWHTQPQTKEALLDTIVNKGIDFEPDTDFAYSNSNYVLLSFILEDVYGKSFDRVLEKQIVKPLKLKYTHYGSTINTANNEALSYRKKDDWKAVAQDDMSIPQGAGAIVSTPGELCVFINALFNGELISKESLAQMKPVGDDWYGFAIYGTEFDGDVNGLGHGGNIDAFASELVYFEEQDISIAVTSNGAEFGLHDVVVAVMKEVFGQPYKIPSFDFVTLSSEELDQYLGTYETADLPMDMTISKSADTLMLQVPGQSPGALSADGNHQFSIVKYGVKVTFEPENGKMHFEQQGMKFELTLKTEEGDETIESVATANNIDLDQYVGTYASEALPMDLKITSEEDKLMLQTPGQPADALSADGNHQFSIAQYGVKITFEPENDKMYFEQGGKRFEFTVKATAEAEADSKTTEKVATTNKTD